MGQSVPVSYVADRELLRRNRTSVNVRADTGPVRGVATAAYEARVVPLYAR